jgi:hypothetical protein
MRDNASRSLPVCLNHESSGRAVTAVMRRKLPVVIHSRGESNLNVATALGRILRSRGIDATVGPTEVEACNGKAEAECFALKRPGGPLEARMKPPGEPCDLACVLILAGAVHRSLPAGTRVMLIGMEIHNRLAPHVSRDERVGELLDIVDKTSDVRRRIELPASEWTRLRPVTETAL